MLLTSKLLSARGVRHGFSTRRGGVSVAPFAALNTAAHVGDAPEAVRENVSRVLARAGLAATKLFTVTQVHGATVRDVTTGDAPESVAHEEADALCCLDPGISVGIRTADCVPILLHDMAGGAVAAVHAGWRGVAAGVVGAGLSSLVRRVGSARSVVAAIGPCIGRCCFEVGEDVVAAIEQAVPIQDPEMVTASPAGTPSRWHLDLRRAVRMQLLALGVPESQIDDVPGCTRCEGARFFSFRRDGARSGRMLAVISTHAEANVPHVIAS